MPRGFMDDLERGVAYSHATPISAGYKTLYYGRSLAKRNGLCYNTINRNILKKESYYEYSKISKRCARMLCW